MRLSVLVPLALAAFVVPFSEAIIILPATAAATTATTATLALAPGGVALAATAAAVVGALALGAVALAAGRRGKRDTASHCLPIENVDVYFTLAANSDPMGCGLRLVCELEATADDKLTSEEQLILSLFGRSVQPLKFSELQTPRSGFQYAAFVGSRSTNVSDCAKIFDQCPFDHKQMMDVFKSNNAIV